jgi:FkbH-like protein
MRVIILGTSGVDLLVRPLQETLSRFCAPPVEVIAGGYAQWRQNLLAPTPEISEPKPDVVQVLLDGEDLLGQYLDELPKPGSTVAEMVRENLLPETLATLDRGLDNFPSAQFLVTTISPPSGTMLGSLADSLYAGVWEAIEDFNRGLRQWAGASNRTHVLDLQSLLSQHGWQHMRDARLWALARCRWSQAGLRLIAERVAALWNAIHGKSRKCLVLDLDNTLWGGIIGDDGLAGIQLGHEGIGLAYREFQLRLRRLRALGVLLAIASKNDASTVWTALDTHRDMVLRQSDFASWRINWSDKAENVREVAEELNIGLDALVFIDDNPVERERVRKALPQVAVPEWPAEVTGLPEFAEQLVWDYFNRVTLTDEDLAKTEQYQAQARRRELETKSQNLEDFLCSLEMQSHLLLPEAAIQPRLAQLTQKTNQFNTTTRRYTEAELARLVNDVDWLIVAADLTDCFGDNGIVTLALLQRASAQEWRIDNFLMSCRVFGRTLEQAMLWGMAQMVLERGGTALVTEYVPTDKNNVVCHLWSELGFTLEHLDEDGHSVWSLDLSSKMPEPSAFINMVLPSFKS